MKLASIDTLRIWIYNLFSDSQVLKNFMPHSFRAAATIKTKKLIVNIEDILKQGCWKNMNTFKKYYENKYFIMQMMMQTL